MADLDHQQWRLLGQSGRDFYLTDGNICDLTRNRNGARVARLDAAPKQLVVDLDRTALIVIDMQNDFCSSSGWLAQMGADVSGTHALIDPINRVTAAARQSSVPVIWLNWGVRPDRLNLSAGTRFTFDPNATGQGLGDAMPPDPTGRRPDGARILQKDSWGADIVDGLQVGEADILVDKHRLSGFWDTPLDSILRNLDVRTLMFAGINSDECVLATLMDANFHGYDTILMQDCTATTSPDFCYDATIYNVRFCLGFTTESGAVVGGFAAAATPN